MDTQKLMAGAAAGLLAAFVVDVHAFLTWTSPSQIKTFAWQTAILRWVQGAVSGVLAAYGLTVVGGGA
jgi:hypothetical protein